MFLPPCSGSHSCPHHHVLELVSILVFARHSPIALIRSSEVLDHSPTMLIRSPMALACLDTVPPYWPTTSWSHAGHIHHSDLGRL